MNITIDMTEHDFNRLWDMATEWRTSLAGQERRWETWTSGEARYDDVPASGGYAYWVGDNWVSVMFARAFLTERGNTFDVLWDMAPNPPESNNYSYVVVTDYVQS